MNSASSLKKFVTFVLCTAMAGCATTYSDFSHHIAKHPDAQFCVLAVEKTKSGRSDKLIREQQVDSWTTCGRILERVKDRALQQCVEQYKSSCMVAYVYDRASNTYISNESVNVETAAKERESTRERTIDGFKSQCDTYGFVRDSAEHANCVMKIDESVKKARQISKKEEEAKRGRESQCQFARAAEYARPALGGFIASMQRAEEAYENCMQGVPAINTTCTRDALGNFNCVSR